MAACPFGAIMPRLQIIDVLKALKSGRKVVAMLAPAAAGQFNCGMDSLAGAVKKLGFYGMAEVAMGADVTSLKEADEFADRIGRGEKLMTSSCCPAYAEAVEKHIPELKNSISSTPTPMHFVAEWVRKKVPGALTVFVGPCSAKRKEGILDDAVDFVLNFHELNALFEAKEIDVANIDPAESLCHGEWQGRGFPVTGGTTTAIQSHVADRVEMKPLSVDGLTSRSIKLLKTYAKGNCPGDFVEVMACEGGCVGGPGVMVPPKKSTAKVEKLVKETEENK
jgi:iron only hydrogenase large subunit-like protein